MNLKNMREYHETLFNKFGIATSKDKPYEKCVEELLYLHLQACKEIEMNNEEIFKREFLKITRERTN